MTQKNQIIIAVIILLVAVGGSFYGGMVFGQNQKRNFNFAGPNQNVSIRGNRPGGANAGEIIAKDEKSITIKLPTGGSKIIFYSNSTQIGKFTSGTADALAIGQSVNVNGTTNSDGSVTAVNIQIK